MATQHNFVTEQEYLQQERLSSEKHEYVKGEVFAMAGASRAYRRIATNILTFLASREMRPDCEADSDTRIYIPASGRYTYPDVVLTCGESRYQDDATDTLVNPSVIFEVLSPKTEVYDRGEKFRAYSSISSFKEYVLVFQEKVLVEHFSLEADVHDGVRRWRYTAYEKIEDVFTLQISIRIPLQTSPRVSSL